jgi:hypothetical protein
MSNLSQGPWPVRLVTAAGWVVAIAVGLRHVWHGRYEIIGDGISYLDIGDAFARGDWANAFNAYWSPLYAWTLGAAIRLSQVTPSREYLIVAAINAAIYVLALAAFTWLMVEMRHQREQWRRSSSADRPPFLSDAAWIAVGFAGFIWTSNHLAAPWQVTPDMMLAAIVFLSAALVVRLRRTPTMRAALALGVTLGLGYAVKTPMFVLAPVFLLCAALVLASRRRWAGCAIAVAGYLVVAAPFVGAISADKDRFTYGDSGRINLAWDVNGVPRGFWDGGPEGFGTPLHPPRRILDEPRVYEFARPFAVSYPPWHDPSYWYDGVKPEMTIAGLVTPVRESTKLFRNLLRSQIGFVAGVLVLLASSGPGRGRTLLAWWPLWIPAIAGLGLFTLAGAEGRYVAPFLALAIAAAVSSLRRPAWRTSAARALTASAVALLMLSFGKSIARGVLAPDRLEATARECIEVGDALTRLGLARGDRVALIRAGGSVYFARVAGLQIVAEVRHRPFWDADDADRERALKAIAATGARALVTSQLPNGASPNGWVQLGATRWHAYPFQP